MSKPGGDKKDSMPPTKRLNWIQKMQHDIDCIFDMFNNKTGTYYLKDTLKDVIPDFKDDLQHAYGNRLGCLLYNMNGSYMVQSSANVLFKMTTIYRYLSKHSPVDQSQPKTATDFLKYLRPVMYHVDDDGNFLDDNASMYIGPEFN